MSLSQTPSRRYPSESLQAKVDVHQLYIHRVQPPAALLQRSCAEPYVIPGMLWL